MLYHIFMAFRDNWSGFNIFRYITVRTVLAAATSFIVCMVLGPFVIRKLTELKVGQNVRTSNPNAIAPPHESKQGTPTMGGILILAAVLGSTVLWADLTNAFIQMIIFSTLMLGLVGFTDDYLKIVKKPSKGLSAKIKLLAQVALGLIVGTVLYASPEWSKSLEVPFLKNVAINLGILYILAVVLIIAGSSNAVNLTDGLDGLAIGCVFFLTLAFAAMTYVAGNIKFSQYLMVFYVPGAGELTIFCAAIAGACLGFLWFNCHPAQLFMGDTGALSLGGAIGLIAIFIKKELLLVLVGGLFVVEALSVLIQVGAVKLKLKRPFLLTPIHHHFEKKGWHEAKIVVRFWIISAILALATLLTLKLR